MKNIAFVLLSTTLALTTLFATTDRLKDMQALQRSMSTIETGIFYNNPKSVKKGTTSLSSEIKKVQVPLSEEEKLDPTHKFLNAKILCTSKILKDIDTKSQIILERFVAGDARAATQAYTHIMKQCMQCHQEAKNW
jgi:hypothetical protein